MTQFPCRGKRECEYLSLSERLQNSKKTLLYISDLHKYSHMGFHTIKYLIHYITVLNMFSCILCTTGYLFDQASVEVQSTDPVD